MKTIIMLFAVVAFVSCKKENDLKECGTVVSKHRENAMLILRVSFGGVIERIDVKNIYDFASYNEGDEYCR